VEQEQPGERRERRFTRPAEEGARPGSYAPTDAATTTAAPNTGGEGAATEAEIMTKLPRSRPERRSTRRTGAKGTRKTTATRSAASRKRTAARKQPQRGLTDQITDATIQTATMPFRATFAIARRAGRLIGRLR
jgi:hypothetical protein